MDIASLSTAMSTQNILNDVSVAMLSKSLDTVEDMGDGMVKDYGIFRYSLSWTEYRLLRLVFLIIFSFSFFYKKGAVMK